MNAPVPTDPYKIRSIEALLQLFDGGDFLHELMQGHRDLRVELVEHRQAYGRKATGTMTITIGYELGKHGDVAMSATASFKGPKKPAASTSAYINDQGELTLYSPMMAQVMPGPRDVVDAHAERDVTPHDPVTGEVRDIS